MRIDLVALKILQFVKDSNGEKRTIVQFAEKARVSIPTVKRRLETMQNNGLIKHNTYTKIYHLTEAGKIVLEDYYG